MLRLISKRFYYHRPPGNPNLPLAKINELLRKSESSWIFEKSCIARLDVSSVGANEPSEDNHFQTILKDESICIGVMDGHWTGDCSRVISYALPHFIEANLTVKNHLKTAFEKLDIELLSLPWKSHDLKSVKEIENLDPKLKLKILMESLPCFAGSCAIVAQITGRELVVAHAGDCRAILGIYQNKKYKAKALTQDHQPSNLRELTRLHNEHPGEDDTVAFNAGDGPLRVLGGMMPSRAFGDARYKWSLKDQEKIDALLHNVPIKTSAWLTPPHFYTPPYLTATPDTIHQQIHDHTGFLVLASDGIFDVFSNTEVVEHISQFLANPKQFTDTNAATHLIRMALTDGKGPQHLSRMLSLPSKLARRWRDDMTVQVIFFESTKELLPAASTTPLQRCS